MKRVVVFVKIHDIFNITYRDIKINYIYFNYFFLILLLR